MCAVGAACLICAALACNVLPIKAWRWGEWMPVITDAFLNKVKRSDKAVEYYDSKMPGFLARVLASGKVTFGLMYTSPITLKRTRYTIGRWGVMTATEARRRASELLARITLGDDPQSEKNTARKERKIEAQNAKPVPTLRRFLEHDYRAHARNRADLIQDYVKRIENHFAPLLDTRLDQLTLSQVNNCLKVARDERGLKGESLNNVLRRLTAVLNKAVKWKVIDAVPFDPPERFEEKSDLIERYLSKDELSRLYDAMDEWDRTYSEWSDRLVKLGAIANYDMYTRALVMLGLQAGLRRGEALSLKRAHVCFDRDIIKLSKSATKGKKARHIPMNSRLREALAEHVERLGFSSDLMFPTHYSTPATFNHKFFGPNFAQLLKNAKIHDFRYHDLRHSFASWMVMRGVDLYTVSQLLGHYDTTMTQRYAHLAPDHNKAAVEAVSDVLTC